MADSLLQEVDDALRADRLVRIWHEWRGPLLWGAIALVIATAGQSVWNNYQEKRAQATMGKFVAADDFYKSGNFADAAKGFHELAVSSDGNIGDFARLWEARALLAAGKKDDAIAALTNLASDPHGHDLGWRDLACLRLAGLTDKIPGECHSPKDSPLKPMRDEWRASELWQAGKTDEARRLLKALSENPDISSSQRARVTELLATLGTTEQKPAAAK